MAAAVRRDLVGIIVLVLSACADEPPRPGMVSGRIENVDSSSIEFRSSTGVSYKCSFDNRTYMERDGQRIYSGALHPEDQVEIIADKNGTGCYARTVRVVRVFSVTPQRRSPLPRPYRVFDTVFPRGNLTFAGVVRRLSPEMLVLKTRTDPEQIVLLRDDTRYLGDGLPAEFKNLAVNTRVFIRGGRNVENDLEAYQVVWGEIAGPKRED